MKFTLSKKSSGILFLNFEENGKRRRITTGTRDPKIARRVARDIMMGGRPSPSPRSRAASSNGMTMGQLFEHCRHSVWSDRNVRSQATVRSNIKILTSMIGDVPVREMTYLRLEQLVQDPFNLDYAAGTVHRKMCAVSKALNVATRLTDDQGRPVLAGKVPMPSVVSDNTRDRVLSKTEEAAIFAAIAARTASQATRDWRRFGMLVRFLLDTGCRLGEALNVEDCRIEERAVDKSRNQSGGVATFVEFPRYTTKNKKPRVLPLTDAIVASLPYLRLAGVGGKLFPLKSATVWYMFDTIRKDVKASGVDISDVVLHTMRHTCLTRLAQSGKVRIEHISEWAGHSSLQVTSDHYLHMVPEDRLSTLDVLNAI